MDSKTPSNACRRCGATAYQPVITRDASGAMTPSGTYRCVGCQLEFNSIDQWRGSTESADTATTLTQGQQPTA
jgi:DNA-directed RNA polymerase subunit RPC12/RpoP